MLRVPTSFAEFFENAMKRKIEGLAYGGSEIHVNLGSGNFPMENAHNLDLPEWRAPLLPYADESVDCVHAYHFLEHLTPEEVRHLLQEVERVLTIHGVLNYCVPYVGAPIAFMDIDHRTYWTEETMRTLLESRGYDSSVTDQLQIVWQLIAGLDSQNLAVMGQLRKGMME